MKYWALFKEYAHQVSVAVALFLITLTGLIVDVRLAMGLPFPEGHDTWLWILAALAGVNVAGMGVIRATSPNLAAVKAAGKAAAAPAIGNVENANITQGLPVPAKMPQAGVKPTDPNVVAGLTALADGLPFKGVPDDAKPNAETEEQGGGLG